MFSKLCLFRTFSPNFEHNFKFGDFFDVDCIFFCSSVHYFNVVNLSSVKENLQGSVCGTISLLCLVNVRSSQMTTK